jgi:hypothetical protein
MMGKKGREGKGVDGWKEKNGEKMGRMEEERKANTEKDMKRTEEKRRG